MGDIQHSVGTIVPVASGKLVQIDEIANVGEARQNARALLDPAVDPHQCAPRIIKVLKDVQKQHRVDVLGTDMFVQFKSVDIVANHQIQMLARLLGSVLVKLDADNLGAREFFLEQLPGAASAAADIEHGTRSIVEKTGDLLSRTLVIQRVKRNVRSKMRLPQKTHFA